MHKCTFARILSLWIFPRYIRRAVRSVQSMVFYGENAGPEWIIQMKPHSEAKVK